MQLFYQLSTRCVHVCIYMNVCMDVSIYACTRICCDGDMFHTIVHSSLFVCGKPLVSFIPHLLIYSPHVMSSPAVLFVCFSVEVAWMLKLHFEAIRKSKRTHRSFPDQSCEQLSKCRRWVDPDTDEREQVRNEVEPVFA